MLTAQIDARADSGQAQFALLALYGAAALVIISPHVHAAAIGIPYPFYAESFFLCSTGVRRSAPNLPSCFHVAV